MKKTNARIDVEFGSHKSGYFARHTRRLPVCPTSGEPCFDERHQANDAAKVIRQVDPDAIVATVRCTAGRHYHLEVSDRLVTLPVTEIAQTAGDDQPRRLIFLDGENATHGAHGVDETPLAEFMAVLTGQAMTITAADRIVVGASRIVARKLHAAIAGPNVEWVIGRDEKDGADRALLDWARLNLRALAQGYDELVVISGDHCFETVARRWLKYGPNKRVHVVTTETTDGHPSLSLALSAIAHRRTLIRRTSRAKRAQNQAALDLVARTHRRVHVDNPPLVAA